MRGKGTGMSLKAWQRPLLLVNEWLGMAGGDLPWLWKRASSFSAKQVNKFVH